MKHIKANTLVILDIPAAWREYISHYEELVGVSNNSGSKSLVLCLGEITNMRGHYIFVNPRTNKIIRGLHSDFFRMPTEDEI